MPVLTDGTTVQKFTKIYTDARKDEVGASPVPLFAEALMSDKSTVLFGQTEIDDKTLHPVCNLTGYSHVSMWNSESCIECIDQHGDICIIRSQEKPLYVEDELAEPTHDVRGLPYPISTKVMQKLEEGCWVARDIKQGKQLTIVEAQ